MMRLHVFLLLLFIFLSSTGLSAEEIPHASPEDVNMSPTRLAAISRVMQRFVDDEKHAGSVVMVARHGKIVFFENYGLMDIEANKPMRKDTIFRIYSMSKSITTAAALMLQEEGKLRLDAPVEQLLPELAHRQVYHSDGNTSASASMTVADLMRHTSGLVYESPNNELTRLYETANVGDDEISLDEMTSRLAGLPIQFEPGSAWVYGRSTDVLGRVIEVVSGQPLDQFLQQRIFTPLDMRDTGFHVPQEKLDRFAACYKRQKDGGLELEDAPAESRYAKRAVMFSGGGGLVSTARDYMRFLTMIANGGMLHGQRLLRRDTVDLMTTNQVPPHAGWVRFGDEVRTGVGFGFGFSVFTKHSSWDSRGRIGEWGWGGAASTHYWGSPEDDLIVVTMEQTKPYSFETENAIKRIVYNAIQDEPQANFPPQDSKVLFLGDSITNAGHYISMIDAWFRTWQPQHRPVFVNLGLPSETVSGLSEPAHPFPRPNVHERLDRALEKVDPDIVVACYGMNDGIYHPFSQERMHEYQLGIRRLMAKVHDTGAKLILMTPPPFDPEPFRAKGKLLPANANQDYAWFAIYEKYDQEVIKKYADWILTLESEVDMVIDLWSPVTQYVQQQRTANPDFALSNDGVHMNEEGHRVLARAILSAWGHRKPLPTDRKLIDRTHQRSMVLHNAWLSHVGHQRPGVKPGLPLDEARARAEELDAEIAARLLVTDERNGKHH